MYSKYKQTSRLSLESVFFVALFLLGSVVALQGFSFVQAATVNKAASCADNQNDLTAAKKNSSTNPAFKVVTAITCQNGQQITEVSPGTAGSMAFTMTCNGNETPTILFSDPGQAADLLAVVCYNGSKPASDNAVVKLGAYTPPSNDSSSDSLTNTSDPAASGGNCASTSNCDLIREYINPFIDFLAALIGVAVVISIVIGGIQFGSSAGDPQKATAAKNRIRNAIIALVTFLFLYALLNFLIPGGLL